MTLEQLDALIADAQAIAYRPGIWIGRDGTCKCGAVEKPSPPGAGTWEVMHAAFCPMRQAFRLLAGLRQMKSQLILAKGI